MGSRRGLCQATPRCSRPCSISLSEQCCAARTAVVPILQMIAEQGKKQACHSVPSQKHQGQDLGRWAEPRSPAPGQGAPARCSSVPVPVMFV